MLDFDFCTLNVASLAKKNKEDAVNAIKHLGTPKTKTRPSLKGLNNSSFKDLNKA